MFSLDLLSVIFLVAGGVLLLFGVVCCLIFLLSFVLGLVLFVCFPSRKQTILLEVVKVCVFLEVIYYCEGMSYGI